jgi:penicillin amidase
MTARTMGRRLLLAAAALLLLAVAAAGAAGLWLHGRMAGSLPQLDGGAALRGLGAPAIVARDALGTVTITGASRLDVARAPGWVHAQDRYFQMDVLRRRGAGELAELFGAGAVPLDREARLHPFRQLAGQVIRAARPERLAVLQAYVDGVNAGLAALPEKPWEYAILRTTPRPWTAEDSILVGYAMTLDLQDGNGHFVRSLAAIRDTLGPASLAFFAPVSTANDAALDGSLGTPAPIPPASEVDLRPAPTPPATAREGERSWEDRETPGSNNSAVAGSLTANGGALVANDMHLHLAVPNIWYRASLRWPGHEETGVTLPGAPMLVAGSTGKVAWGFTNSNAGTGDIVLVDSTVSPELYHGPGGGVLPYGHRLETIAVKGSPPVTEDVALTLWGPVVGIDEQSHRLVYHWAGDDARASNLAILDLEQAADVRQAVAIAHQVGIPPQNFIVADSHGAIAWTVAGAVPRRVGYDGRLPVAWKFGDRRWDGFLTGDEIPTIVAPADGILWTANNRTVGGRGLFALGDSGYDIPARARQVRDDLRGLVASGRKVVPRDLLGVQLDDRAVLLEWWKALLARTLRPEMIGQKVGRDAVLQSLRDWNGTADAGSVSYRVVRAFRLAVAHRVLDPIFAPCLEADPEFTWTRLNYEQPLETVIERRPAHLLSAEFPTWDDLLAAAVDDVARAYAREHKDPRTATWGQRNTARIEHPFAALLPRWAGGFLRMPADQLPGDTYMPRFQDTSFGASERFVVSPGHEDEGIFHMPGGQTSNPASPFYRAGHEAWVHGEPTPFLPGPPIHTVTLAP